MPIAPGSNLSYMQTTVKAALLCSLCGLLQVPKRQSKIKERHSGCFSWQPSPASLFWILSRNWGDLVLVTTLPNVGCWPANSSP
jgi:hypothetical protein